ncbi:MAG: hypothetical protein PHC28_04805 [Flavobacterium sp.]|uniref:DUF6915 family protein n=1 Tax=Flavobacterium sp. TaxID=239 RepID=UPI00261409C1|nr:hypothetical protein [Flavobacterium sp.]MDD5149785.1 hypothetical protein [Flavobacterium sp.]
MKPFLHAKIHAKKYGGIPEDYIDIDNFIDSSKQTHPDVRHRAILHNAFGCFIVEQVFGITRINSAGKTYSPRDIAEDHCQQDMNRIFSVESYLRNIKIDSIMPINNISIIEHTEIDVGLYNISYNEVLEIHSFLESSFNVFPDIRHHALLHHSFGIYITELVFGKIFDKIKKIPTSLIVKNHLSREFGHIPVVSDYLNNMIMQDWMSGSLKYNRKIKLVD